VQGACERPAPGWSITHHISPVYVLSPTPTFVYKCSFILALQDNEWITELFAVCCSSML